MALMQHVLAHARAHTHTHIYIYTLKVTIRLARHQRKILTWVTLYFLTLCRHIVKISTSHTS